jgi:hypothetical protein
MPRVAVPFDGVPDGQVHPRHFAAGDVVEGDLAKVAKKAGWLEKATRPKKRATRRKAGKPAAPRKRASKTPAAAS